MAKRKKFYCGKCGNHPRTIMQETKGAFYYDLDEDGYLKDNEGMRGDGGPTGKILALCICGHMWRLKRIRNISELERKEAVK